MICDKCTFYHGGTWLTLHNCTDESPCFPAYGLGDCAQFIPKEQMSELEEIELRIGYRKRMYVDAEKTIEHCVTKLEQLEAKRLEIINDNDSIQSKRDGK